MSMCSVASACPGAHGRLAAPLVGRPESEGEAPSAALPLRLAAAARHCCSCTSTLARAHEPSLLSALSNGPSGGSIGREPASRIRLATSSGWRKLSRLFATECCGAALAIRRSHALRSSAGRAKVYTRSEPLSVMSTAYPGAPAHSEGRSTSIARKSTEPFNNPSSCGSLSNHWRREDSSSANLHLLPCSHSTAPLSSFSTQPDRRGG
mmetsp:Transcript_23693/g.58820  ORF Transcript_23693/g.58820 Transcript_23693/m.58820 type:complete len:208 (+) Transcript_23693:270-893(+)